MVGRGHVRPRPPARRGARRPGASSPARSRAHRRRRTSSASVPRPQPTSTTSATSGCWRRTHAAKPLGSDRGGAATVCGGPVPVPLLAVHPGAAEPAVEAAVRRPGRLEVERRVRHPPVRSVRRGQELVGVRRRRQGAALERGGAEREDPVPLERGADLAHQDQVAVVQEAAEHVEPADRAVGLQDVDLERGTAVAADPVAHLREPALEGEGLADHVDRVGVLADVAEVGVAVVADQLAAAHRAEQRAVRRERVDAGGAQRLEHLLDGVQQRRDVLVAAGVEGLGEAVALVEAERPALGVDDRDPGARRRPSRRSAPRRTPRCRRRARPARAASYRRGSAAAPGATRRGTRRRAPHRRGSARTTRCDARRRARRGRSRPGWRRRSRRRPRGRATPMPSTRAPLPVDVLGREARVRAGLLRAERTLP